MTRVLQDLRFAIRMLVKSLGFTTVALLTLAIGIGASTAIFSIADEVLLQPLPYRDADRLVTISGTNRERNLTGVFVSLTRLEQIRAQSRAFEIVAGYTPLGSSVTTNGVPEQVSSALTNRELFELLGVTPVLGRNFTEQEDRPGGPSVAIISDGFWHSHFGGRSEIVGKRMTVDGKNVSIVGVLPAMFEFSFLQPAPDIWMPRVTDVPFLPMNLIRTGAGFLQVYGRLRPGQPVASAQADIDTLDAAYKKEFPGYADQVVTSTVTPLKESLISGARTSLLVLVAAVGFLLLIGCTNLASLLLSRATARRKEIAIRTALGASRKRLVQQLLTESLLLAFVGGAVGTIVVQWSLPLLSLLPPGTLPRVGQIHMNSSALLVALGLCVVTGTAFGLVPSLQISKNNLQDALKESSRGSSAGGRAGRSRAALMVVEVATATVLICTAGLLMKSFGKLVSVNPGFDPHDVVTMGVNLPQMRYPQPGQQAEFYRKFVESVQTIPSVQSAGVVSYLPVGSGSRFSFVCPQETICKGVGKDPLIAVRQITPDYFRTMRIALLRGRVFNAHDNANSRNVVIVNETAAQQFFPGQDAVGKQLTQSRGNIPMEIVGVVSSVHFAGQANPFVAEMYMPQEQNPSATMVLVVRTDRSPQPIVAAIRSELAKLDPDLPLTNVLSMNDVLAISVAQPRLITKVTVAFSGLTLLLAAIGLYGVTAFSVAQRKQEVAIRIAMGATPGSIARLIAGQGLQLVVAGVVIGLLSAFAFTRVLQSILFELSAQDPITFAGVTLVLVLVAAVACYIPARRAMRVDPIIALRVE
jgi:putative ABC transport system permease protein